MTFLPAPDRWRIIAPILEQVLDLPPEERGAFLDRACGSDSRLRAEIEDLLNADSDAGTFLGAPVDLSAIALGPGEGIDPAEDSAANATRLAGTTIGPYKVVREIGRGGMGVVYEAEQQRPRRAVALKVILGGRHVDATTLRMFQREADSLARLKHPSIAAIYESGSTDDGQHYLAMELVHGRPLSDHLKAIGAASSRPEARRRLTMFRKIAAAVAYAHQRGVIHRDLKPSNILVLPPGGAAAADGAGAPAVKLLDFGLARITEPDAEAATAVTALGSIQGTLAYMSPEQVRGRRDDIDVRTDVYALGLILYRLLTDRLPYDLEGAEFPEAARIICDQPPRPLTAAAGARITFDRDLAIIVQKALEKDPARRYPTVAAFDEDLGRYLSGQPILARPASAAYQMRMLVARHKVPFAAAGALLIALLAVAIVTTVQARRIAAERDRANREARTAVRVSNFLTDLFKVSDPNEAKGNAIKAREILDKGVEKIGKELADEPEVQARLMLTMGQVYLNLGLYPTALPILEKSVETRRRLLGEENPDTLTAMNNLAILYEAMGHASEAEKLYALILPARRRLQGEDHPDTLRAMSGLAIVYSDQARHEEQEKLARQVLEAERRVLGDDHLDTLLSMFQLASAYYSQRRYAEAEALGRPALERLRRVLGEDDPRTLTDIRFLATVNEAWGHSADAEKLLRDALNRQRRVLGEDHPQTLTTMNNLAVLLDHEGRSAEAEVLDRETLLRRRRVLGEDHQDTLMSMNNLANELAVQGRYVDAEALYRESLDKVRRLLGENHPDTSNTMYNLACLASLRGDRRGALDWLGQAVTHGYSHWDVMAKDSDLKRLRGDPAFEALVARSRKNSGK